MSEAVNKNLEFLIIQQFFIKKRINYDDFELEK